MGKKSRRDRGVKEKKLKDEPARIKAVEVAKKKIEELGLSPEVEGIKKRPSFNPAKQKRP